jgi:hypothetical protein
MLRHASSDNARALVNSIFDILSRRTLVSKVKGISDCSIHLLINPICRPNPCNTQVSLVVAIYNRDMDKSSYHVQDLSFLLMEEENDPLLLQVKESYPFCP